MTMTKTAAFVTYNNLGGGIANGWHERDGRRGLVLQNTKGHLFVARREPNTPAGESRLDMDSVQRVKDEIGNLWGQLQKSLPELDLIVVYVGDSGSERAIELAATLPATKTVFVACNCGWGRKMAKLHAVGLSAARVVECGCGGHGTMGWLFERFMATGEL